MALKIVLTDIPAVYGVLTLLWSAWKDVGAAITNRGSSIILARYQRVCGVLQGQKKPAANQKAS